MTATAFGALAIILVGVVLRRAGVLREEDGHVMVRVVLYATLPALVFLIIVRADLTPTLLLVPLAGFIIHGVMVAGAWAGCRLAGRDRPTTGAFIIATAVGNTGFFGLPLIAASGGEFLQAAGVMYDALCTAVITWTSTVAIAAAFSPRSDGGARVDPRSLVSGLTLPPTWGLAAGLAWNLTVGHDIPGGAERPLEIMAGAVLPLVMLYAGVMVDLSRVRARWRPVAVAAAVRLGIGPVVGFGVGWALGLDGIVLHTVVIMSAMPTAMMSLVLGAREGLDADLLAGAVVVTTLLCTLTLPLVRTLIA
ncbi:MAG: AEC family transporter [Thermoleophilia bacterium]|nr:AEC family transporter [Thermoleophilia bacterium]